MNSTMSDWNTKFRHSFDYLHPSVIPSFSNPHTHDILVAIGLITVCLLLLILLIQFCIKVRHIYRTSEPKTRYKKYPSYQKLINTDNNQCKCFQYSCLPKFQCMKSTCQISNQSPYYEQINERQLNNSITRVFTSRNPSCIRIHIVK